MTELLSISQARRALNSLDQRLEDACVIYVTRHKKAVFALVSLVYFEGLMETLEIMCDPDAMTLLQESCEDIRAGRVHEHDDVKREFLSERTEAR